tara:strand:- start:2372 stop:2776 length:405 start_codon:yes stop_codon:yes gene_type:complete
MNKLNVKRIFLSILLIIIIGLLTYNYVYKKQRNIKNESPSFVINAIDLINEFALDLDNSSKKYLDKTLQITGIVTLVENSSIEINKKITCYFNDTIARHHLQNKKITLKGRCIGFDELLEEIKIDQCTLIPKFN